MAIDDPRTGTAVALGRTLGNVRDTVDAMFNTPLERRIAEAERAAMEQRREMRQVLNPPIPQYLFTSPAPRQTIAEAVRDAPQQTTLGPPPQGFTGPLPQDYITKTFSDGIGQVIRPSDAEFARLQEAQRGQPYNPVAGGSFIGGAPPAPPRAGGGGRVLGFTPGSELLEQNRGGRRSVAGEEARETPMTRLQDAIDRKIADARQNRSRQEELDLKRMDIMARLAGDVFGARTQREVAKLATQGRSRDATVAMVGGIFEAMLGADAARARSEADVLVGLNDAGARRYAAGLTLLASLGSRGMTISEAVDAINLEPAQAKAIGRVLELSTIPSSKRTKKQTEEIKDGLRVLESARVESIALGQEDPAALFKNILSGLSNL